MPNRSGPLSWSAVSLLLCVLPAYGQVVTGPRWSRLAAGESHTCGLTTQGMAYCWGRNSNGEIGNGVTEGSSMPRPTPVTTSETFTDIAAGDRSTCAVSTSKTVYCWGYPYGASPRVITGTARIERVFAAADHACALDADGVASCWGSPLGSVLGTRDESREFRLVAVPVDTDQRFATLALSRMTSCGLNRQGAAYCWGTPAESMVLSRLDAVRKVPVLKNYVVPFTAIAAGQYRTCATDQHGFLYCWGPNGQYLHLYYSKDIGTPSPERMRPTLNENEIEFQSLTGNDYNVCGLDTGGRAFCLGENAHGQLGVPPTVARSVRKFLAVASARRFTRLVIGGNAHLCGVATDGSAYCWGRGENGELGDGGTSDRVLPVQVMIP